MIREIFEYCLTPASYHARRTGYLYEAVAFESRARRNERNWRPHWSACHDLVEEFCSRNTGAESLAVFGSGCLYEIPRDRILKKFKRVFLIDQVFPRSVRTWARQAAIPVALIECDLARSFPQNLKVDLALSANLLSQLSLPQPEKKKVNEEKHLRDMKALGVHVLLWTDTRKIFRRRESHEILHQESTVLTPLGSSVKNWIWDLAPAPEVDSEIDLALEMSAFHL